MKKMLVLFACTFLYFSSFAQKGPDHITMKQDGKVYWIRGGETIKMAIDVPLKNGSVVNYKGEVKAGDGSVTQLKIGDKMLMDGTMKKETKKQKR